MTSGLDLSRGLGATALVWITATVLAYAVASAMYRKSRFNAALSPVLVASAIVIGILGITRTPYEVYSRGAEILHFLLGPATVALAVPLYAHVGRLRSTILPLLAALAVGSVVAVASAILIGRALGASDNVLRSLAPKSATMPIAMAVTQEIGGVASLTAVTVTLTGISGAVMARWLHRALHSDDGAVEGFAVGVTSHAIGVGYALKLGEAAGAFAALGMGLNGIATAVIAPLADRLGLLK